MVMVATLLICQRQERRTLSHWPTTAILGFRVNGCSKLMDEICFSAGLASKAPNVSTVNKTTQLWQRQKLIIIFYAFVILGCERGEFFYDCSRHCHCAKNDTCNVVTGVCPQPECSKGWDGPPTCETGLPSFYLQLWKFACNNYLLFFDRCGRVCAKWSKNSLQLFNAWLYQHSRLFCLQLSYWLRQFFKTLSW